MFYQVLLLFMPIDLMLYWNRKSYFQPLLLTIPLQPLILYHLYLIHWIYIIQSLASTWLDLYLLASPQLTSSCLTWPRLTSPQFALPCKSLQTQPKPHFNTITRYFISPNISGLKTCNWSIKLKFSQNKILESLKSYCPFMSYKSIVLLSRGLDVQEKDKP